MEKKFSHREVKQLFDTAEFVTSVFEYDKLPNITQNEVAFVGRSNVGKSSLINALLNDKKICHTSNTPGRTQSLNFINLTDKLYIVDVPGYGYAEAPKDKVKSWNKLIKEYLQGRPNLRRVFLLIDSRRSIKDNDLEIMTILDKFAVSYKIILTKIDKVSDRYLTSLKESIHSIERDHPAMHQEVLCTSTTKWIGIEEVRLEITQFI